MFGTLNDPKEARMSDRYNVSKLLEVLTCREITREHPVEQLKVTLNFVSIAVDAFDQDADQNQGQPGPVPQRAYEGRKRAP